MKKEMGTDNINEVNLATLKDKIEGEKVVKKGEFRKGFTNMLTGKKNTNYFLECAILFICKNVVLYYIGKRPKISKGEEFKNESNFASNLGEKMRHPTHGFHTLSYTVSEACKTIEVKVLNKSGSVSQIGIRTKDVSAKAGKDYHAIPEADQKIVFNEKEEMRVIKISIIDDEQWNEDREFGIELFDLDNKNGFE